MMLAARRPCRHSHDFSIALQCSYGHWVPDVVGVFGESLAKAYVLLEFRVEPITNHFLDLSHVTRRTTSLPGTL